VDLRDCHPHEIVDLVTAVKPGEHMTKSQKKRVRGTATISLQWTCDDVTDARGGFGRSILTAFGGGGYDQWREEMMRRGTPRRCVGVWHVLYAVCCMLCVLCGTCTAC